MSQVERGLNTDITISGVSYHIQTEDWGEQNPYLVSQVFRNGAVIKSIRNPYTDILPKEYPPGPQSVRLAMELQHQQILDLLNQRQML